MMTGSTFRAGVASIAAMSAALSAAVAGRTPLMLDMKRMAIHDGPGVRITFFVKGCPLRCVWCRNPESIGTEMPLAGFHHLCRRCVKCRKDGKNALPGRARLHRRRRHPFQAALPSVDWCCRQSDSRIGV